MAMLMPSEGAIVLTGNRAFLCLLVSPTRRCVMSDKVTDGGVEETIPEWTAAFDKLR